MAEWPTVRASGRFPGPRTGRERPPGRPGNPLTLCDDTVTVSGYEAPWFRPKRSSPGPHPRGMVGVARRVDRRTAPVKLDSAGRRRSVAQGPRLRRGSPEGRQEMMNPTAAAIAIATARLCQCLRCGYVWFRRFERLPARCAQCRSPYWLIPRHSRRGRPPRPLTQPSAPSASPAALQPDHIEP